MKKILTLSIFFLGNSYASNLSDLTSRVQNAIKSSAEMKIQLSKDTGVYKNAIGMMETVEKQKTADYINKISDLNIQVTSLTADNNQYNQNLNGLLSAYDELSATNLGYSTLINNLSGNLYTPDPVAFGEVSQNLQGQVISLTSQNQSLLSQIQALQEEIAKNNTHDVNNGGGTSDNNNGPIV
jgi:hypothetical protein